ncbi:MAG TPA: PKD-like family lipoprotein [Dinghuibacter sp.]|uniref:PKD-like family lipoprotein n=1 Tax=Dinghuibacter sp. TaxID=2024697 RepID=UPI002BB210D8|nr:PKD-like family lipoprotein [Dinghuibacter sp.]HTJ13730.1 PKD-like family lipoprotein [Dinghuibacter sp.]
MRKILLYGVLLVSLVSCYKDLGNYSYHAINQLTFTNFDTVHGYTVFYNDTLRVSPAVIASLDKNPSYVYQWSLRVAGPGGAYDSADSVIAVTPDLDVRITNTPGTYTLQYRVTDNNTGITFQTRTTLLVTSQVYEGFLVLNDVGGQSRLDMLSYDKTAATFTQYTDVLKKQGSALTLQGQPYQVLCAQYTNANINPQNYGIFLLTSAGTNRVNQETFGWDPTYNISYLMIGDLPAGFAPQHLTVEPTYGAYPDLFLYYNANIYNEALLASQYSFKFAALNSYTASGTPFTVSPYVATDGSSATLYDMDARAFVTQASYSSPTVSAVPTARNYPTGEDLVYMERAYSGSVYAVLRDTTASPTYRLMRFTLGAAQNYYQPITGTDIALATSFAFSPDLGYMFYSVGGKLYEYDLSLQTSFLMLDKGSANISYLSFHEFYKRATNTTYATWARELLVGSANAGGNGTLELYSIPPVNGQIVQQNQWTGFGRIVSVAYRER